METKVCVLNQILLLAKKYDISEEEILLFIKNEKIKNKNVLSLGWFFLENGKITAPHPSIFHKVKAIFIADDQWLLLQKTYMKKYDDALSWCEQLGGTLPTDEQNSLIAENIDFINESINKAGEFQCKIAPKALYWSQTIGKFRGSIKTTSKQFPRVCTTFINGSKQIIHPNYACSFYCLISTEKLLKSIPSR